MCSSMYHGPQADGDSRSIDPFDDAIRTVQTLLNDKLVRRTDALEHAYAEYGKAVARSGVASHLAEHAARPMEKLQAEIERIAAAIEEVRQSRQR